MLYSGSTSPAYTSVAVHSGCQSVRVDPGCAEPVLLFISWETTLRKEMNKLRISKLGMNFTFLFRTKMLRGFANLADEGL